MIRNGQTYDAANPLHNLSEQQLVDCVRAPQKNSTGAQYKSGG